MDYRIVSCMQEVSSTVAEIITLAATLEPGEEKEKHIRKAADLVGETLIEMSLIAKDASKAEQAAAEAFTSVIQDELDFIRS